jgi:hypothetical protein
MEYIILSYNERELLKCPYNNETDTEIRTAMESVAAANGVESRLLDVFIETKGGARRPLDI